MVFKIFAILLALNTFGDDFGPMDSGSMSGGDGQSGAHLQMAAAQQQAAGAQTAKGFGEMANGAACLGQTWGEEDQKAQQYADKNATKFDSFICRARDGGADVPPVYVTETSQNGNSGQRLDCPPEAIKVSMNNIAFESKSPIYVAGQEVAKSQEQLKSEYKSKGIFGVTGVGNTLNYLKCAGHFISGAMSLKAAKDLKNAAKENSQLADRLTISPNDPLLQNPNILGDGGMGGYPNPTAYQPVPGAQQGGGPDTGLYNGGNLDSGVDAPKDDPSFNEDYLRKKFANGDKKADSGRPNLSGVSTSAAPGFNGSNTSQGQGPTGEQSIGDIGGYDVVQGGSGRGGENTGVGGAYGRGPSANPEDINKAFNGLLAQLMGDKDEDKKSKNSGDLITASRNPANNKNVTGDESINITSKSIFEIVRERIVIVQRRGNIEHPAW